MSTVNWRDPADIRAHATVTSTTTGGAWGTARSGRTNVSTARAVAWPLSSLPPRLVTAVDTAAHSASTSRGSQGNVSVTFVSSRRTRPSHRQAVQQTSSTPPVGVDLRSQRIHILESALVAQPLDERHLHR